MALTLTALTDLGGDVLQVDGTDVDGSPLRAHGWMSATTNFFPAAAFLPDGSHVPAAVGRAMNPPELRAYAIGLLQAVSRAPASPGRAIPLPP